MSKKDAKQSPPKWWKNTYFWIAAILIIVGLYGVFRGDQTIRDPGQRPESNLALLYFGGALLMFVNGFISHRATVQSFKEEESA